MHVVSTDETDMDITVAAERAGELRVVTADDCTVADLDMEVVSPDNPDRDIVDKRTDYAEAGIPVGRERR